MEAKGVKIQDSLPLFQMNFENYFWNFSILWYFFYILVYRRNLKNWRISDEINDCFKNVSLKNFIIAQHNNRNLPHGQKLQNHKSSKSGTADNFL
jgi:hypothetical protein